MFPYPSLLRNISYRNVIQPRDFLTLSHHSSPTQILESWNPSRLQTDVEAYDMGLHPDMLTIDYGNETKWLDSSHKYSTLAGPLPILSLSMIRGFSVPLLLPYPHSRNPLHPQRYLTRWSMDNADGSHSVRIRLVGRVNSYDRLSIYAELPCSTLFISHVPDIFSPISEMFVFAKSRRNSKLIVIHDCQVFEFFDAGAVGLLVGVGSSQIQDLEADNRTSEWPELNWVWSYCHQYARMTGWHRPISSVTSDAMA